MLTDYVYKFRNRIMDNAAPIFGKVNQKRVNNHDFTIISNNCWGGYVYRYFGLPYQSPTIGVYFFADEYIKFIYNLRHYLQCDLKIIDAKKSRYYEKLKKEPLPLIGKIDDVEIVFLHYDSSDEAMEKWSRRVERVNFDNIIIKFSQMNNCNRTHLQAFDELKNIKKFMFVASNDLQFDSAIYYKGYEKEQQILNDTLKWNRYINVVELINQQVTKY